MSHRAWLKAQGARHIAQGKNNQMKLILSLSFTPYALSPMPLRPAKPFNSDLALRTQ